VSSFLRLYNSCKGSDLFFVTEGVSRPKGNVPNIIHSSGSKSNCYYSKSYRFHSAIQKYSSCPKGAIVFTIMLTVIRINAHSYLLHIIYFQPAEEKNIHKVLHKIYGE
jgi:hypothetical protein